MFMIIALIGLTTSLDLDFFQNCIVSPLYNPFTWMGVSSGFLILLTKVEWSCLSFPIIRTLLPPFCCYSRYKTHLVIELGPFFFEIFLLKHCRYCLYLQLVLLMGLLYGWPQTQMMAVYLTLLIVKPDDTVSTSGHMTGHYRICWFILYIIYIP